MEGGLLCEQSKAGGGNFHFFFFFFLKPFFSSSALKARKEKEGKKVFSESNWREREEGARQRVKMGEKEEERGREGGLIKSAGTEAERSF